MLAEIHEEWLTGRQYPRDLADWSTTEKLWFPDQLQKIGCVIWLICGSKGGESVCHITMNMLISILSWYLFVFIGKLVSDRQSLSSFMASSSFSL